MKISATKVNNPIRNNRIIDNFCRQHKEMADDFLLRRD